MNSCRGGFIKSKLPLLLQWRHKNAHYRFNLPVTLYGTRCGAKCHNTMATHKFGLVICICVFHLISFGSYNLSNHWAFAPYANGYHRSNDTSTLAATPHTGTHASNYVTEPCTARNKNEYWQAQNIWPMNHTTPLCFYMSLLIDSNDKVGNIMHVML